jgi:hypothetical protein
MKKITLILMFTLLSVSTYAQCPIPATSFVGEYALTQITPNHNHVGGPNPSFNTQVVTLNPGATPNSRVFSAVWLEALDIGQPAMDVSFTLDCPNGNAVIVDPDLDTFLTCDVNTPGNITLGPASTTGTFDVNDDSSFTLILSEYVDNGQCTAITVPFTTEFSLTKVACNAPQNISVSNITASTADVSWTDPSGTGTSFDVEFGLEGFTPGSGTVVSGISSNSTTLTGLQQGNFYDVYVTSNCGSDSSIPAGPANFLIASDCNGIYSGFPFSEDFDSLANLLSCYTIIDEDTNGTAWTQETIDLGMGVFTTISTNGTNAGQKEDYLISPPIAMTTGNIYDFSVTYNGADSGGGPANENLEVLIATGNTVADANAGTSIFTDTGISQNGDFANIENQALTGNGQFTPGSSGDYYVVFKSTGGPPIPPATATGFLLLFDYALNETLSVDVFESSNFDYFVDSRNMLNLSANQSFEQIYLHNLLGQQVLSQKLNASEEMIDLNSLNSGVYLAQVQLNGSNKTFKIIKK